MKLAIMQPYFFPYLAHFALIAAVDEWVVFDITQYTRKSWINRNRVLRPDDGWQYISIPLLESSTHIRISEARVAKFAAQELYVLGKLSHYKRRAPYHAQVCDIVRKSFAEAADHSLVSLNVSGLRTVCGYLGLPFRHRICSQLVIHYPHTLLAGQWAPWIAAKLSADVYINPIGGRDLFDPADFGKAGVHLQFLDFSRFVYATPQYEFQDDMSILDVLMWNAPEVIVKALRENASLVCEPADSKAGNPSQ